LLHALGVKDLNDGVVRCSMAHYNTAEEVDRLIYAIDDIL
jgi:selenocysteine lyase/cysteine desulfurase